jgi:predicted dehydrogenase
MLVRALERREFLAAGLAGVIAHAAVESARGYVANDEVRIGLIGFGGRCRQLLRALVKIPGATPVAVCDVFDEHLEAGRRVVGEAGFVTKDYRALLDQKNIDAVLIATPDHWHVPITVAACAAGKDVYVEKPLTHDVSEGAAVIEAQNRHQRIVQVGTQQRSMPQYQQAREIIQAGQLGEIHKVRSTWNRNTPRAQQGRIDIDPKTVDWQSFLGSARQQPFDPYRFRQWRWFWDFGGGVFTDLMTHQQDIVNWCLNLEQPALAASLGDHVNDGGLWETPDSAQTLVHYPDKKLQVTFEATFANARNGAMIEFMGSEATLYVDRGRFELIPERKSKTQPAELVLGDGAKGQDFYANPDGELLHLTNWLDCVRSRQRPIAPAEAGVAAVWAPHLANHSLRSERAVPWTDLVKQEGQRT